MPAFVRAVSVTCALSIALFAFNAAAQAPGGEAPTAPVQLGSLALHVDTADAAPVAPPPPAFEKGWQLIDVGAYAGVGVRIGGSSTGASVDRAAPSFGLGAAYSPSRWWGAGIEFDHTYLGHESNSAEPFGTFDVTRNLNALWLDLEVHLVRAESVDVFFTLGPGIVWMTESASILALPGLGTNGSTSSCSDSDGARLGLRAGVGAAIPLGSGIYLTPMVVAEGDQLTSGPVGNCAPGPGGIGVLTFRAAFFHRTIIK